jgi:hypothetical protein
MPATPRRHFIVMPRSLLAAPLVVHRRYEIVVPRPMPAAPRRYLIVVPRPMPALARRYLIAMPAAPLFVHRRYDCCARPLPAAPLVVRCSYLILVPRPLPAAALVVHRRAVFICHGVQAVARDGARCASKVLHCGAQAVARGTAQILKRGA